MCLGKQHFTFATVASVASSCTWSEAMPTIGFVPDLVVIRQAQIMVDNTGGAITDAHTYLVASDLNASQPILAVLPGMTCLQGAGPAFCSVTPGTVISLLRPIENGTPIQFTLLRDAKTTAATAGYPNHVVSLVLEFVKL